MVLRSESYGIMSRPVSLAIARNHAFFPKYGHRDISKSQYLATSKIARIPLKITLDYENSAQLSS